jgi:hypothetical protein
VTESAREIQGSTVTTKQIHSLDRTGMEMTVETIVRVEHGYTIEGTKNFGAAKDVFKKTAPQH